MDKKYKYAIKKFAKLLTVHPDKRVTFQDTLDLRDFIGPAPDAATGVNFSSLTDLIASVSVDDARIWTQERNDYWPSLVEHGDLLAISNQQFEPPSTTFVSVVEAQPFKVTVEFNLNPEKVAAWLAATGFPQISRAKEETPPA